MPLLAAVSAPPKITQENRSVENRPGDPLSPFAVEEGKWSHFHQPWWRQRGHPDSLRSWLVRIRGSILIAIGGPKWAIGTLFAFLIAALTLSAHDVTIETTLAPPAVVARILYGGNDPVAFAKVVVHAPGSEAVYQSGNADAQGYFCFRPSSSGDWRISADDEMGHARQAAIRIPDPFTGAPAQPPSEPFSRLQRTVLGIALLIGLSGFWYGFRSRRA